MPSASSRARHRAPASCRASRARAACAAARSGSACAETRSSEESARWSRCTPCVRGRDELPEPVAPALARRAGGWRSVVWLLRRAAAHAVRGPVHEHGRARDRRLRANLAEARAARALRARARRPSRRARAPSGRADGVEGARDGDPRHRHVTVDAGAGRRADEAGRGPGGGAHVPRPERPIACGWDSSSSRGRRRSQLLRPGITISFERPWTRSTRS